MRKFLRRAPQILPLPANSWIASGLKGPLDVHSLFSCLERFLVANQYCGETNMDSDTVIVTMWSWTRHLGSWCLSFLICKNKDINSNFTGLLWRLNDLIQVKCILSHSDRNTSLVIGEDTPSQISNFLFPNRPPVENVALVVPKVLELRKEWWLSHLSLPIGRLDHHWTERTVQNP